MKRRKIIYPLYTSKDIERITALIFALTYKHAQGEEKEQIKRSIELSFKHSIEEILQALTRE